jgi:hypothetical protein
MNLRQLISSASILILSLTATAFAADPPSGQAADDIARRDQLRALLKADAKRIIETNPEHVLVFYESAEKALASYKASPMGARFSSLLSTSDPVLIAQFGEISVPNKPLPLSQATKDFVEASRKEALAAAIQITQTEFSGTARLAAEIIKQNRDDLTIDDWKSIVDGRQYVIHHRDQYPAGINTWANGFSYIPFGYVILKTNELRSVNSNTILYFDGVQKYPNSTHGLGWRSDLGYVGFEKLSIGTHDYQLKTTYKFKLGAIEFTGKNESDEIAVEITAADTPAHLAAEIDDELTAEIEASIVIAKGREITYSRPSDKKYKAFAKIMVPALKIAKPLSVSLCMKPEIYIEGEEKPLTRYAIMIPAGTTNVRILENAVGDNRLAALLEEKADANGKLKAKLVLRPSRVHALSHPIVKSYYPKTIEREIEFSWRPVD